MSPGLELAKCMAIALAAWILPRSFLAPVVACGAVQLWSMMQQCLRRLSIVTSDKPKKIHEFENFLATVQTLCDRRNFSILAAVVVILVYLALGDSIKTSHFLLSAAFQAALAFSLGILVAAILPEKETSQPFLHDRYGDWDDDWVAQEEVQEPYNCPCGMKCGSSSEDSCPYGADFWSDFEENEKIWQCGASPPCCKRTWRAPLDFKFAVNRQTMRAPEKASSLVRGSSVATVWLASCWAGAGTYPFNFLCFLSAMDFLHSATEALYNSFSPSNKSEEAAVELRATLGEGLCVCVVGEASNELSRAVATQCSEVLGKEAVFVTSGQDSAHVFADFCTSEVGDGNGETERSLGRRVLGNGGGVEETGLQDE
eukprot:g6162.t1